MLRVRLFGRVGDDGPSMDCGPVDAVVYPGVDGGPLLLLAGDLVRGGGVGSAYDGGSMGRPPFARVFCSVIAVSAMVAIKSSTYWVMSARGTDSVVSSPVGDTVLIPMWLGGCSGSSSVFGKKASATV